MPVDDATKEGSSTLMEHKVPYALRGVVVASVLCRAPIGVCVAWRERKSVVTLDALSALHDAV